jgi:hypothetical protein
MDILPSYPRYAVSQTHPSFPARGAKKNRSAAVGPTRQVGPGGQVAAGTTVRSAASPLHARTGRRVSERPDHHPQPSP